MPVEPFDVTDENGVRVTGTAEAYRDRNGPYYDPNSRNYHNPRYSDHDINYLNTRDVCRINPSALSTAVQKAFHDALIRLGVPKPSDPAVENDVNKWITETLRQCALHPNKYVSNQPPSSVGSSSGKQEASSLSAALNSGARPMNAASGVPQVAFPLEAPLSPDRARALNDWASSSPRRPMGQASPSTALQTPPTSMADSILDHLRRQQQQNASQPQSSVFDTGAASLPFIPTTALASSGGEPLADNPAQDKLIRRLMRVRAG